MSVFHRMELRPFLLGLFLILQAGVLSAAPKDLEEQFGPRPLDGVFIEAVQTYTNPKNRFLGFDLGMWPLNPYYDAFSLNADYTYFFNRNNAWEVLNFAYLYTVDTAITAELAESYKVNPKAIRRAEYVISSNFVRTLAYGKFIMFGENIRYFRATLILGPALVATNQTTDLGLCLGVGFETFVNSHFSWRASIRDNYTFSGNYPNNLAFTVGTSFGF